MKKYQVTKQYGRGPATFLDKKFSDVKEAEHFILEELEKDARLGMKNTIYHLIESGHLLREYTEKDRVQKSETSSSSAAGQGARQTASPTPFNTSLRRGPQSFARDEKDKDKEG